MSVISGKVSRFLGIGSLKSGGHQMRIKQDALTHLTLDEFTSSAVTCLTLRPVVCSHSRAIRLAGEGQQTSLYALVLVMSA